MYCNRIVTIERTHQVSQMLFFFSPMVPISIVSFYVSSRIFHFYWLSVNSKPIVVKNIPWFLCSFKLHITRDFYFFFKFTLASRVFTPIIIYLYSIGSTCIMYIEGKNGSNFQSRLQRGVTFHKHQFLPEIVFYQLKLKSVVTFTLSKHA